MEIGSVFRLFRWRNLALIIVLQGLVAFRLHHACKEVPAGCFLDLPGVLLIIATTLFVTAAGYVVNDIRDVEIDRVNRPDKMVIGKVIGRQTGWWIYIFLVFAGSVTATGLVICFGSFIYLAGYMLATVLLLSYSLWWKKSFLAGNLLVSLMCAAAVFVLLLPDWGHPVLETGTPSMMHILLALMWFAAIMTLYREIVKDIEDVQGDRLASATTMPVRLGSRKTKAVGIAVGLLAALSLAAWLAWSWNSAPAILNAGVVLLSLMMVHNILLLKSSATPGQLYSISQYIKLIMLFGVLIFLIY